MKKVITANTLKTGEVVFWGKTDWVSSLNDAVLFHDDDDLNHMMRLVARPDHVVGVYSFFATEEAGQITPHHIREKIRATGPGNYNHRRHGDATPMKP